MRKIIYLCSLFLLLLATTAMAQQQKVTGTVSDETGKPIEGASVQVKGKALGTVTNALGVFSINAKKGDKITISSIGFNTKEFEVNGNPINAELKSQLSDAGEVIVVGYGTQKKASVTSAVQVIKGSQLQQRSIASTSMTLQGFAPDVVVQQGSGQPGADGGSINIRGISSITGSSAPLIIVDGAEGASLNDIDPNIIEDVTILKDAASTAVYGVRGTNGVILIKTKRGKAGKTNISFNSFITQQNPTNFLELLSSVDNMILNNEAVANTGSTVLPFSQATIDLYRTATPDNMNVFNTDWKNLLFQNSRIMQNHNLQVSGEVIK